MSTDEYDLSEDTLAALENISEHREALENLMSVIETLDESGLLDLLEVVGTRDVENNEQFYEAFAEDPASLRAVQNLSLLANGLSGMDPDTLATMLNGMQDGERISQAELRNPPKLGLLGMLKQLRDPAVQRGLGTVFLLLERIGARSDVTDGDEV